MKIKWKWEPYKIDLKTLTKTREGETEISIDTCKNISELVEILKHFKGDESYYIDYNDTLCVTKTISIALTEQEIVEFRKQQEEDNKKIAEHNKKVDIAHKAFVGGKKLRISNLLKEYNLIVESIEALNDFRFFIKIKDQMILTLTQDQLYSLAQRFNDIVGDVKIDENCNIIVNL